MRPLVTVLVATVVVAPTAPTPSAAWAVTASVLQTIDLVRRNPSDWIVRRDSPRGDAPRVERRHDNLRIRTGAAGILHLPDVRLTGQSTITAEVRQFDPANRNEAYGLFLGGMDLGGDDIAYTYFLIRQDGSVLVKRREGARTRVLRDWRRHASVIRWIDRPEGAVYITNTITLDVSASGVTFSVNGSPAHRLERAVVTPDGVPGLRVNHGLDIEVVRMRVTRG